MGGREGAAPAFQAVQQPGTDLPLCPCHPPRPVPKSQVLDPALTGNTPGVMLQTQAQGLQIPRRIQEISCKPPKKRPQNSVKPSAVAPEKGTTLLPAPVQHRGVAPRLSIASSPPQRILPFLSVTSTKRSNFPLLLHVVIHSWGIAQQD